MSNWKTSLITKITWVAILTSFLMIAIIILCLNVLLDQRDRRHHRYYARTVHAVAMRVYENPAPAQITHIAGVTGLELRYRNPVFEHASDSDMPDFEEVTYLQAYVGRGVVLAQGNGKLVAIHTKGPHKLMIALTDDDDSWETLANTLMMLIVALALLWGGFYFYQRRLLSPLRVLRNDMEAVGRGEWRQTKVVHNDEIGDLATGFNQMQEKLRATVQVKMRFLADASHELRSPLARLRLATEFVHDEDLRARMRDDAVELERLTGDIMEKTRLENFDQSLKKVPLRLSNFLFSLRAKYPTVTFFVAENMVIEGDADVLLRAISNLLDNAIKFAAGDVRIDCTPANGGTLICVRDDGPGVSETDLLHLFEPFYRADTSRSRETGGFGLGLSIVKTSVEAHGGTITAKNADSGGLIVELWLPTKQSSDF